MLGEDGDSNSGCLYIHEEEEPPSPKRQKTSENQNTSTENISPDSNTKPSELLNERNHSAELPPANDNNLLNAIEGMPGITIRHFACISDASNSNENEDSDFLDLLAENKISISGDSEQHTAISVNKNVLRAEAQNNDPRVRRVTAATGYQKSPGSHMNTPQDQMVPNSQNPFGVQNENTPHMLSARSMNADRQAGAVVPYPRNHSGEAMFYGPRPSTQRDNRVNTNFLTAMTNVRPVQNGHQPQMRNRKMAPISQNPFGVQNENTPHMLSAPSMNADRQAGAVDPYPRIHSGGAMFYGPRPSTQRDNRVNTNFLTAMTNVRPVQHGHQPQIYTDACKLQYSYNLSPAEYNDQVANYNRRAPPPTCQMIMSAPPSNHQQMFSMGMTYNEQRLASTNHQLKSVPMARYQNCSCKGCENGRNFVPNYLYTDRKIASDLAKMQLDNFNLKRMQSMRTEATNVASTSGHVNVRAGVKTTIKSAHTNIQIAINTYSGIPADSTYNNISGSGAGLNIPNWDAFRLKEAVPRKRAAKANTNTLKAKSSLPVKNQVHAPLNMRIPTKNSIEISSLDSTSACTQPNMNNIPNLAQPPLNTGANLTTMRTNSPKDKIVTVSHFIDVAHVPMSKEGNLHSAATYINNDGAQNVLVEAPQGAVDINTNRDSAQIPLIMDQQTNMNLNMNKSTVKTTMLNTVPNLAAMDMATTAETLQTGAFIKPANNNTNRQITVNLFNNNYRAQTDTTPTPKTLVQASSNSYGVKESTTSTTIENISHNIESNAVLTSDSINAETHSVQDKANANSILKTVDHRIETTTARVVNQILNRPILVEYFQGILNNVQQISTKPAVIDDQNYENQVRRCDFTDNYIDNNKLIAHITTGDHNEAKIDHEPHVIIVSKPELEIARKNLARWSAIERKAPRYTENQYIKKIPTDVYGEYIAQVIKEHFIDYSPIRTEQISGNNNETISFFQKRQETEVLRHRPIENSQEINESRENIRYTTRDEAKGKIHETIEINAPVRMVSNNSETNSNAAQRYDATENSTNERQSYSRYSLPNQKDGRDSRQTENSDLENALSLITTGLPLSPKEVQKKKIDDLARANANHVLDGSRTTLGGNNEGCVVSIQTNRLKELLVKALMERKNVKSNTVSTEAATGTSPTQDINSNASRDSQDNNKNLEKHRKTPRENDDQSSDNTTRVTEEVINNSRNTLKKNCISNEEELPQVHIPGRKQKEMISKEKKSKSEALQPVAGVKYKYRCFVCSVIVSYSYLKSHMKDNHLIEDHVVPRDCIYRLCRYCGIYHILKSYNTHIKTAHKDIYNAKPNQPKKVIFKFDTEVVTEAYISL